MIVVALLTVERLIVVAAVPEPITTISEEVVLDDLLDVVLEPEAEDSPAEVAEEPDEAAEEEPAAVWLAELLATEEEGAAELVVSTTAEVADEDGASDEVAGSLVGVV